MNKDLLAIFEYLEREKGIKREVIVKAIEESLLTAARKSIKGVGKISVQIQPKSGEIEVYTQKKIVKNVENPEDEISLEEALELTPDCQLGQWLEISITPQDFGRIAAQAARQVISGRLKTAERDVIHEEYRHRLGEIISGTVTRFVRGRTILVDLGKVLAVMPDKNYPYSERYNIGDRIQALLYEVKETEGGGAEVILTRSHPEFVQELFMQEVPELAEKTIIIEKIVREPGFRTKMAVRSFDSKIDPVGTCVGVRGTRIKNVIRELNNEKIDVIPYSDDPIQLLQNSISPVEIKRIQESEDKITIIVSDEDYPTVIGKKGINARLTGKLIGSELLIQKMSEYKKLITIKLKELSDSEDSALDDPLQIEQTSSLIIESLIEAGYDTLRKVLIAEPENLISKVPGVNYLDLAEKILDQVEKKKG